MDIIEVEIWSGANPPVFLDTLPSATDVKYLDELYGPGSGSLTVPFSDPRLSVNPGLIAKRNIVRIKLNQVYRGAWVIQKTNDTYLGDGDLAIQVHEVSGEGLRTYLNDAVLQAEYPGYNTATTLSARNFNFASERIGGTWYNPAQWKTPAPQCLQNNPLVFKTTKPFYGNPWRGFPNKWPDGSAVWIWDRDTRSSNGAPPGSIYFRREFDIQTTAATLTDALGNQAPIGGGFTIYITCDNGYKVYLDSMELGGSDVTTSWRTLGTYAVTLASGRHTLGVHCVNTGPSKNNPAGLLVAVYQDPSPLTNADGTLINYPDRSVIQLNRHWIFNSVNNSSWKMLAYPTVKPGWNIGEILIKIWAEAAARGVRAYSMIKLGFTPANDSYGKPWGTRFEWSLNVGDSYTMLFGQFEALAGDFWFDPATFKLMAYNTKGYDRTGTDTAGAGHPPDGKTSIYLSPMRNLLSSTEDIAADPKTAALLMSKGRWTWVTSAPGLAAWGRTETFLSVAEQEQLFATKIAGWTLDKSLILTKSAAVTFVPDEENRPWEDFSVGDWILVESRADGHAYPRRIMSIGVESNENAELTWAVEMDTPEQSAQLLIQRRIDALAAGGSSVIPGTAGTLAVQANQTAPDKTVPVHVDTPSDAPPPKPNPPVFVAPVGRPAVRARTTSLYLSTGEMRGLGSVSWYPPSEAVDESPVVIVSFPLQVKASATSAWVALPTVYAVPNTSAGVMLQHVEIQDMRVGVAYQFRVAAISNFDMQSDWALFNLTANADNTPPPTPTRPVLVML